MEIKTLNGSTYTILDIDCNKDYKYIEIKEIFSNIKSDKHFGIIQDTEQIYNNLYDILEERNKIFKLKNLIIIFFPYSKEDTEKIKLKCKINNLSDKYEFIVPNNNNNLATEFNLSETNLEDDELFMLYCVNICGNILYYASEDLKNNIKLIFYAYSNNFSSIKYVSNKLKDNEKFVKKFNILEYASDRLKDNEEFVYNEIIKFPFNFKYISNRLKNNKNFVLNLLNLQKDKLIKDDDKYFSYIKVNNLEDLVNDKEIVLKCLELEKIIYNRKEYLDSDTLNYIGHILKYDRDIIIKCLEIDGSQLKLIPNDFILDKELILIGLNSGYDSKKIICESNYEDILDYIPKVYRKDKEIVILAIRRNGNNFLYASKQLRNDIEIIIEAINNCYYDIDNSDKYYRYNNIIDEINKIEDEIDIILNNSKFKNIDKKDLPKEILYAYLTKIQKQYRT
jgi:hypothetical protein